MSDARTGQSSSWLAWGQGWNFATIPKRQSHKGMVMKTRITLLLTFALSLVLISTGRGQDAPPEIELKVITEPPPEQAAGDTQVGVISTPYEVPDDFWTHGTVGDLLMRNDFAGFTFGAVPEGGGDKNRARPGSILDIFPALSSPEGIQLFQPSTDHRTGGRTVYASAMEHSTAPDGSARVAVYGEDKRNANVAVDTIYEMQKGWPGVLATTTVTNDSDETRTLVMLGDYIGFGASVPFVSGQGWMREGGVIENCEFIFTRFEDTYTMFMPLEGLFEFRYSRNFGTLVYERNVKLEPGESRTYQRWIVTELADPGKLYSFVVQQRGLENFGYLAGRIQERVRLPDGRIMESDVVGDAEVRVNVVRRPDLPREYLQKPYVYTVTDASGNFQVSLPPGEYSVAATTSARRYQPSNVAIKVEGGGQIAAADLPVSKASTLSYEIRDSESGALLPGKLSFLPLRGTDPINLGPPAGLESGGSVYTLTGRGAIEVPAGNYRVIASHGNEFHMEEQRVRIETAQAASVSFEMRRAFNPEGWISADPGVMTRFSPHSRISPEDRVISAVAEGLDWIVTADLNHVTNLQPVVERLGVASQILASPGIRIPSTKGYPRGEYILFPTDLCSAGMETDLSAIFRAGTPRQAIDRMRSICPNAVIMANRPIFPLVGMMTVQGYDFSDEVMPEGDLVADVDAYQIWEGKRMPVIGQAMRSYYRLVSRGFTTTPIANSLSAGTFNEEPGYPRIYIPSKTRDPRKFNVEEFARAIKEGSVQITNGPFINMKVNGAPMGSLVTDTDKTVELELEVYTPNWASVADIQINLNGNFVRKFILPAGSTDPEAGKVFPRKEEDKVLKLQVFKDSILDVIVRGDPALYQDPVNPLAMPTREQSIAQGQTSFALSAPIFIDVDGNGVLDLDPSDFMATEPEEEQPSVPPF